MAELLQGWLPRGYGRLMSVPRGLRVGLPATLAQLLTGWRTLPESVQVPEIPGLEGQWLQVRGGPLPVDVVVRVDRADDDRLVITGLLIGLRDRREITWETLRNIKPATLLEWIFSGFDPKNPASRALQSDRGMAALQLWKAHHAEDPEPVVTSRAGVTAARNLHLFAEAYRRNLASTPQKAMTATARELNVSRATAIRRAQQCRDAGLLPPKRSMK
jgi:hypothetical protein